MNKIKVSPMGKTKGKTTYLAKVGTGPSTTIVIKRVRTFDVGDRIEYAFEREVMDRCYGVKPPWHGGLIRQIQGDMLFIERW